MKPFLSHCERERGCGGGRGIGWAGRGVSRVGRRAQRRKRGRNFRPVFRPPPAPASPAAGTRPQGPPPSWRTTPAPRPAPLAAGRSCERAAHARMPRHPLRRARTGGRVGADVHLNIAQDHPLALHLEEDLGLLQVGREERRGERYVSKRKNSALGSAGRCARLDVVGVGEHLVATEDVLVEQHGCGGGCEGGTRARGACVRAGRGSALSHETRYTRRGGWRRAERRGRVRGGWRACGAADGDGGRRLPASEGAAAAARTGAAAAPRSPRRSRRRLRPRRGEPAAHSSRRAGQRAVAHRRGCAVCARAAARDRCSTCC